MSAPAPAPGGGVSPPVYLNFVLSKLILIRCMTRLFYSGCCHAMSRVCYIGSNPGSILENRTQFLGIKVEDAMTAAFFRVSAPVYRGLAVLAQHKAVLVPLGPKLPRKPDDAMILKRVRSVLAAWHKRVPWLERAGSVFVGSHSSRLLMCPPSCVTFKPRLRSCGYSGLCPFCWSRRVGETWDRLYAVLFDGNRAKYRVSTSEFVMRVPEEDIAGEIVGYLENRRKARGKRNHRSAKQIGGLSFATLAMTPGRELVLRRRTMTLWPLDATDESATTALDKPPTWCEAARSPIGAACVLGKVMRYPPFLIRGVDVLPVASAVDAMAGVRQLTFTGILRGTSKADSAGEGESDTE